MKADILLLITAALWGFAFVAQRQGNAHMGPFTFNAIRFTLGALVLIPLMIVLRKQQKNHLGFSFKETIIPGLITGTILFIGASCQQVGLLGTTAGKAGFITGLYVILVPLMALFWGRRTHPAHWIGTFLAVAGLYLLSIKRGFSISTYDLIVLVGAFFWAGHVHLINRYAKSVGAVRLSILQFAVCGVLSGVAALLFETIRFSAILDGIGPILYGSFLSVGLAYTLQVVAQRTAEPSHAAIILSLESVFAALGGWLVLNEMLSSRDLVGCALMFLGMFVSQVLGKRI